MLKHKVLIVEDVEIIADYLEESLTDLGYEVVDKCTRGEDAIEAYKEHEPDILFVEIILQGEMTGVDVVHKVREEGNPMVIYSTSNLAEDVLEDVKKTRPSGFLKKPFDTEQLKATTKIAHHKYLEERKRLEELLNKNNIQHMNIKELSETNAHLVAATWRERDLKKQLRESLEELEKTKQVIELQNRRISDSINYAKRIQQAIIPQQKEIENILDDHFTVYRPKDVVSGDFPWVYKKGDYIYFGAVDCTGHGVPGAMLSLIGHLLLNGIVNVENEVKTPAQVLIELHHKIVKTLKQDVEGNNASDGMDIALCRINTKEKEVMYSGAHRPLYHMSGGVVNQYKGDRFPIGGVQYKGQNNFTDTVLSVEEKDSIYFFSDGMPDQFGGEEKRKFGAKRIRKIIEDNDGKSMSEMKAVFESYLDKWMLEERQLDDILMIGVQF